MPDGGELVYRSTAICDENDLILTLPLYCLPKPGDTDGPLLPAGTPIRDLWRGEDHGELGSSWRFVASRDGGESWEAYETMWDDERGLPVRLLGGADAS